MRKYNVILLVLIFTAVYFAPPLRADFSFKTDIVSRYIWRGFDLNPYKKPGIQPSVSYEFGSSGLSANIRANISLENRDFQEIDLTLSYAVKFSEQLLLKAGLIHYGWYFSQDFVFEDDTTQEVFLSAYFKGLYVDPALTFFYDFTNGDGWYALFEADYYLDLWEYIGSEFYFSLGYNGGQWLAEGVDPGFSDMNLGLALPIRAGRFTLKLFARYTFVLLDAIGKDNHFWNGISLSFDL